MAITTNTMTETTNSTDYAPDLLRALHAWQLASRFPFRDAVVARVEGLIQALPEEDDQWVPESIASLQGALAFLDMPGLSAPSIVVTPAGACFALGWYAKVGIAECNRFDVTFLSRTRVSYFAIMANRVRPDVDDFRHGIIDGADLWREIRHLGVGEFVCRS